jgi:predicted secreted protein
MGKIVGRLSKIQLSDDGGATYEVLGGAVDISMNIAQAEIGITAHSDDDWEVYLPGRKDVSIDCSLRYDEADPGQIILMASMFTSVEAERNMKIRLTMVTDPGVGVQYDGTAFVSSLSPSGPNDDAASFDATLRVKGALVKSVQAP